MTELQEYFKIVIALLTALGIGLGARKARTKWVEESPKVEVANAQAEIVKLMREEVTAMHESNRLMREDNALMRSELQVAKKQLALLEAFARNNGFDVQKIYKDGGL